MAINTKKYNKYILEYEAFVRATIVVHVVTIGMTDDFKIMRFFLVQQLKAPEGGAIIYSDSAPRDLLQASSLCVLAFVCFGGVMHVWNVSPSVAFPNTLLCIY